ncbi:MAG: hypothetical protein ACT4OO_00240 [Nitrospiraceae bacterium]
MTEEQKHALSELAVTTAVYVERAPGPAEKRLVILRVFAEARRINPAVPTPDLTLLDRLMRDPHRLIQDLQDLWLQAV